MNYLYQKLPKDLANIVEEYAKDRTNYDKVMIEFNDKLEKLHKSFSSFCPPPGNSQKEKFYDHILKYPDFLIFHLTYDYRNKILKIIHEKKKREKNKELSRKLQEKINQHMEFRRRLAWGVFKITK